MSKYFSSKFKDLIPYTPGEQPQDMQYVKLNTNESPFPPSLLAIAESCKESQRLQLYSDPECTALVKECASVYGLDPEQIIFSNGSDEVLNFAFMCWCDETHPAAFADITYGFYPVYAGVNNIPYEEIPLTEDLRINVEDYLGINKTIFIANPNAPTGIALEVSDIIRILESNPDNIVVVDEAYVDFGAESMVPYINEYHNLLVVQTFSKARSMAGARLGMAFGNVELINDLKTIKYSTNPYNINKMTMAAGLGALKDEYYTRMNIQTITDNREFTLNVLRDLGFSYTPSLANFIFVKCSWIGGRELYLELKKKGVLVRHFDKDRIRDYIRVTIGKRDQMEKFLDSVIDILEEQMDVKPGEEPAQEYLEDTGENAFDAFTEETKAEEFDADTGDASEAAEEEAIDASEEAFDVDTEKTEVKEFDADTQDASEAADEETFDVDTEGNEAEVFDADIEDALDAKYENTEIISGEDFEDIEEASDAGEEDILDESSSVNFDDIEGLREALEMQTDDVSYEMDEYSGTGFDFDPGFDAVDYAEKIEKHTDSAVAAPDDKEETGFYDEDENDLVIVYDQAEEEPEKSNIDDYLSGYGTSSGITVDDLIGEEPKQMNQRNISSKKGKRKKKTVR